MVGVGSWVRVRVLYCVYKSPHKDRNVRMHVSETEEQSHKNKQRNLRKGKVCFSLTLKAAQSPLKDSAPWRRPHLDTHIPIRGFSLNMRRPPAQNLRSICRVLCLLLLWGPLDGGPCLCMNGVDRTGLTDGPPQLRTRKAQGEGVCVWGGGCARSRVIRGNVFSRIGGTDIG